MKLEEDHLTTPHTLTQYKRVYKRALELGIAYEGVGDRLRWSDERWRRYMREWPNLSYSTYGVGPRKPLIRGNRQIKEKYKPISVREFMALMEGEDTLLPKGTITLIHRLV